MNSFRYLLALPALTLAMGAQTAPSPKLPDRPAAALTRYKDNWAPVMGANGSAPITVSNGAQVELAANAGVALTVGDRYADGFVTLSGTEVSDVPTTTDAEAAAESIDIQSTQQYYDVDLTPDIDIPDAYAILARYLPDQHPGEPPALAVIVHQIGKLTAGAMTHMKFVLPKFKDTGHGGWSLLVFTAGRQVRSTGMDELLPDYFNQVETISLKNRIADRVAKGVDAPIKPFRQLSLGLPDAITAKYHGKTVNVEIKVSAEGHVVSAKPVGLADGDLQDALQKGFENWLFLPPVKDGSAVSGRAVVPLKM